MGSEYNQGNLLFDIQDIELCPLLNTKYHSIQQKHWKNNYYLPFLKCLHHKSQCQKIDYDRQTDRNYVTRSSDTIEWLTLDKSYSIADF